VEDVFRDGGAGGLGAAAQLRHRVRNHLHARSDPIQLEVVMQVE
jgi:hypothetical protein